MIGIKIKKHFCKPNYENYKELCDYDVYALIKQLAELSDVSPATQIAKRLQQRVMPKIIRLDYADLHLVEAEINAFKTKHEKNYQDWQLMLVQTPHQSYSGEEDPIFGQR